jgi:ABC-type dipeptide/oligopeptide/nickel transport system permease subunit
MSTFLIFGFCGAFIGFIVGVIVGYYYRNWDDDEDF